MIPHVIKRGELATFERLTHQNTEPDFHFFRGEISEDDTLVPDVKDGVSKNERFLRPVYN